MHTEMTKPVPTTRSTNSAFGREAEESLIKARERRQQENRSTPEGRKQDSSIIFSNYSLGLRKEHSQKGQFTAIEIYMPKEEKKKVFEQTIVAKRKTHQRDL